MEIDRICRACLRKDDKMIDMSEKEIYQKFLLFAKLTAKEIPDVSLNLCQACEQKLKNSLNFQEECQKSHEILLNYVKNTRKVDPKVQIPLNDVDSKATAAVVANVKKPSQLIKGASELNTDIRVLTKKASNACKYCEKTFYRPSHLVLHERTHTGEKPFICQVCARGFAQKSSLKEHMMVHNIRPNTITCNICNKKLTSKSKLRIHLRDHTGERPFVCTHCGKSFKNKYCLGLHNRTHSDLRMYQCYNCDKSFRQKSTLSSHMLTHSGEKRFKCNQCPKAYRQTSDLTKHMMKHEFDKPRLDRPHVCLMCNRTFTTNALLTCHINRHSVDFL